MTDVARWDFADKFRLLEENLGLDQSEMAFLRAFAQFMADNSGVGDLENFRMDFTGKTILGHKTSHQLVDILENSGLEEAIRFNAIKAGLLAAGETILPGAPPIGVETSDWYENDFDHDDFGLKKWSPPKLPVLLGSGFKPPEMKIGKLPKSLLLEIDRLVVFGDSSILSSRDDSLIY